MGLLGNYNVLSKGPGRALGGSTVAGDRSNWGKAGALQNKFTQVSWSQYSAIPVGYRPGSSWAFQIKAGNISSINQMGMSLSLGITLGTPANIAFATTHNMTMAITSYAVGVIELHISPFTTLSPENLAAAVWNALAAAYNSPGSFGEILNAGGSGLTAQQVRDAMKLAPTVGAPAADSVDAELDSIKNLAGLIPAAL